MNYRLTNLGLLLLALVVLAIGLYAAGIWHPTMSDNVLIGMTTLAADKSRILELPDYNDLPVVQSDIIYEGAAVGDSGTNAFRPLVAGDRFSGFAVAKVDNSTGSEGDKKVRVRTRGRVQLPITSIDKSDLGKAVYASDDDTFTLTQSTNSHIGKVVRFIATGTVMVAYDADNPPPGQVTELTDSSGGTANDTLAAVEATYVQATVANNFADLAAKVNTLLRMSKG